MTDERATLALSATRIEATHLDSEGELLLVELADECERARSEETRLREESECRRIEAGAIALKLGRTLADARHWEAKWLQEKMRHEGTLKLLTSKHLEIVKLRNALIWAKDCLEEARRADLLGGEEGSDAQDEYQTNMAPIYKALR